jgi:tetratricopeptide (TPR) repeat protein
MLSPGARELPRLYEQLAVVQMRRGDLDAAEQTCRAGLATMTPDLAVLREHVQLLMLLGTFDGQRGNYHSAIKALEDSLLLARSLNDPSLVPPIVRNLGLCFYYVGQRSRALACYQESLSIDERTGDVVGQLRAIDNTGLLYLMSGEYDAALDCFLDCLRRSMSFNMRQVMAGAITNIGYAYYMRGDYDRASEHLLQAHTLWIELGDALSLAECLCRMADVALARQEADTALGYAELALDHARQVGSDSCIASALRIIGEALLVQWRVAEAAEILQRAQEVQLRVDEPFGQVLLLRAAVLLAMAQGDDWQAAHLAQAALNIATSQEVPYLVSMITELEVLQV